MHILNRNLLRLTLYRLCYTTYVNSSHINYKNPQCNGIEYLLILSISSGTLPPKMFPLPPLYGVKLPYFAAVWEG